MAKHELKKEKTKKKGTRRKYKVIGRQALKIAGIAIGILATAFFIFFFSVKAGFFGKLPATETLKKIENNTATEIYSADSVLLGRFFIQERTRIRYEEVPEHLINALIATEDARFFDHEGIDYRSLARVFFKTILLLDRTSGGGSTLSQQLAKNLFPRKDNGWLSVPVNKAKEAIIAHRLEEIYTKEEVLLLYLNTVPFGDNVFGVEMAAKRFFNKKISKLSIQEAAVLVGMLKANHTYNPRIYPENALNRRNVVLMQMARYGYLNDQQYDSISALPLKLDYTKITHNTGIATYFREQLRQQLEKWCEKHQKPDGSDYNLYTDGLKIYTTIDSRMQKSAEEAMQTHMADLQKVFDDHWSGREPWSDNKDVISHAIKHSKRYKRLKEEGLSEDEIRKEMARPVHMKIFTWSGEKEISMSPVDSIKHYLRILQTGFLAMDPRNGDIKAWVGGINYEFFKYDHVNENTKRQVGSTFKPIVYAAAIEDGANPCRYVSAEKITYTNLANWSPGNTHEEDYDKKYSYQGALANSVNTVSVRVLEEVGIAKTIALAERTGIRSELPKVPSIALGTANISLLEMVTSYCAFANGGYAVTPRRITAITDNSGNIIEIFQPTQHKEQVLSSETATMMNTMLQGVVNNGTASRYRWKYGLRNDLAGKTGTTQSNADGWFIGYNPSLVVGAWVGADNPSIRFRTTNLGSGANTALPVVAGFFKKIQQSKALNTYANAKFPEVPHHILRQLDCEPVKEEKPFMEWLFGNKDDTEKRTEFKEPRSREKKKKDKKNIFNKIEGLFKKKKDN
ncbi:Multimodular transpeptidase-transglycosylase [Fulvivirga imtechensis AK7]|uniref:Multimodular transpeptidase-transglycosylase n=1 Tax=Fulvivirga imtechensis AK7 TaxID=1237149 RepID=L8JNF3_9BACT|nr:transglycosylase domain-containing protein [Fulvivirga imtechensis]ELR69064.1 Multimodular transpeptidase-transglycosylase [Fulvivirga imtechensis AK7]